LVFENEYPLVSVESSSALNQRTTTVHFAHFAEILSRGQRSPIFSISFLGKQDWSKLTRSRQLAKVLGMSVPCPAIVEVSQWLVQQSPALNMQIHPNVIQCDFGLQYGSEYATDPLKGRSWIGLPRRCWWESETGWNLRKCST